MIFELVLVEVKVIWCKYVSGLMGVYVWVLELYFIDGKWFIYFVVGGVEKVWDICMYVLENVLVNLFEGEWIECG